MSWLRRDQSADSQQAAARGDVGPPSIAPGAPGAAGVPGVAGTGSGAPRAPGAPSGLAAASVATAAPVPQPLVTIDALGRKCPIPIIMLAEQIRDVPVGAVIAVLADDPAAYTDVPAWCGMKSHEFVFRSELDSGWAFGIRRRY